MTRLSPASAEEILEYLLRLGDDRLVLGHRLSEWCAHAPIPEEDIALANIALDSIGHASMLLSEAGRLEGKNRDEDALAFGRDVTEFRNCLLVEQPNGDFAHTMVRQYLFDVYSDLLYERLKGSTYLPLSEIASKSHKEISYHNRHSSQWILRLGDGTEESHRRTQTALDELWKYAVELFREDALEKTLSRAGVGPLSVDLHPEWQIRVTGLLQKATLTVPPAQKYHLEDGRGGRHSEALGHLLTVMQSVPRAHPGARW